YTARLQELLRADGFDATVINGGLNGLKQTVSMLTRLETSVNANTRLVIFEPGIDWTNTYDEATGRVFARLRALRLPTIYVSNSWQQTNEEAAETARKNGAYYYGLWGKNVPSDSEHWQWDGHMTAKGCQLWAKDILPLVKQVLQEHQIK